MIIDVHAHYTTSPAALQAYRGLQMSTLNRPQLSAPKISDEEITQSLQGHWEHMGERGIDMLLFSPRAASMGHDIGDERVSEAWTRVCNDLIGRVCAMFPTRLAPVCQLPQSPGAGLAGSIAELTRCVEEMGFVGCNINPDVSGGLGFTPPLGAEYWYPLWEAMISLGVPGMIHASSTRNPALHVNGSHYVMQDYAAAVELCSSGVLQRFPELRLIVPHGGGGIPFQFNRHRALHLAEGRERFEDAVRRLYFDTSVYDEDSLEMLIRKVGADHVLFGSEMFGTAQNRDPETGRYFDDNVGIITQASWLTEEERAKVLYRNAQRVFSRLTASGARSDVAEVGS